MRLWAYGTSPHGLGINDSEELFLLSPREFCALSDIQQESATRWAISQASFCNAHLGKDAEPFMAEDFLGTGNRDERAAKRKADKMRSAIMSAAAAPAFKSAVAGEVTEDSLPDYFPKKRGVRNGR